MQILGYILRGRIAEVKMKEKDGRMVHELKNGWNYQSGYDHKYKRDAVLSGRSLENYGVCERCTWVRLSFRFSLHLACFSS
ncbi:hypothetical protein NC651_009773 [Populus alba x Populus x berolinensis]|nr:hypothetical protein NC651_009773 [Populus alba x Populus x berolinensis]